MRRGGAERLKAKVPYLDSTHTTWQLSPAKFGGAIRLTMRVRSGTRSD
jgi:hypothetical protein